MPHLTRWTITSFFAVLRPHLASPAMLSNGSTLICLVGPNASLSTGNCQKDVICLLVCHMDRVLVLFFFSVYASKLFEEIKSHLPDAHAYADDTQLYLSFKPHSAASETEARFAVEQCIRAVTERGWLLISSSLTTKRRSSCQSGLTNSSPKYEPIVS